RIIAGEHRGRRIEAPTGERTRPMLDRVREALFSTVQDWVADARVLDLFAGSGSLGLEALSRGAAHARFIERAQPAIAILRRNVELLGVQERCSLVRGDALDPRNWSSLGESVRASSSSGEGGAPASSSGADERGFDLVFFDPPYAMLDDPMRRAGVLRAV